MPENAIDSLVFLLFPNQANLSRAGQRVQQPTHPLMAAGLKESHPSQFQTLISFASN